MPTARGQSLLSRASRSICTLFLPALLALLALFTSSSNAFTITISEADDLRQTCSGMIAGPDSHIETIFNIGSTGVIATMFYEFQDFDKLGKYSKNTGVYGFQMKDYICTPQAVKEGLCTKGQEGNFIIDESQGKATTVQLHRMDFGPEPLYNAVSLRYNVTKDGYYCFGATEVPLTAIQDSGTDAVAVHATFTGRVEFFNKFKGNLPAAEHPKLSFYFIMTILYLVIGVYWLSLCIKHKDELLKVQYFISGTIAFLVVEMGAQWLYYYYLNNHLIDFFRIKSVDGHTGVTVIARALLITTSILDAGRNSVSFFLLLIVAMGYGVIRPTIGKVMKRVQLLTIAHFVFGVLYSVGIVLIQLDQRGAWIFAFIFPLAITLTAFLTWIMNSLKQSIEYLTQRKQTFKRSMFVKLHRILLGAVAVIFLFFVISTIAFSQSGGGGFAPNTWRYRWFLLDGWLGLLYLTVFCAIAWVWRPTGSNMRLAMSDELATDDDPNAEGYEVETFGARGPDNMDSDDEDEDVEAKKSSQGRKGVQQNEVVFEIGDEDDEADQAKDQSAARGAGASAGARGEREGLMRGSANNSDETLVPGKGGVKND